MAEKDTNWLELYQPYRRRFEIGFWVLVLAMQVVFNSIVTWIDIGRSARDVAFWQPLVWELSSNLAVGLLIPAIVAFDRRHPLHWDTLPRNLGWHLAGSVAFCAAHVGLMVALRYPAYALMGHTYSFGNWPTQLAYEYLKDVRSYALILVAVYSYRLVLLRLQGEARVLDEAETAAGMPAAPPAPRPERFLVRKLRKEFLIAAADIEWLQAQGNYLGLHVNGHDYLLRATLTDFLEQLDPARFARVHRSYAVNLDRVAEIEPMDAGDARLRMKDGTQVPCSRRYRDALGR
ncbi:MAG: transcriptional regulator, LytTR family-like protein [Ramlibacter sp.]|nr:transcriptional regulator, LytTR family-like protein [Ramlibacter sp.]